LLREHSYREFMREFKLRKCSVYIWHKHRNHLGERLVNEDPAMLADINTSIIHKVNKRLLALGKAAERKNKPASAVAAYSKLAENVERIARITAAKQAAAQAQPQAAGDRPPTTPKEVAALFTQALEQSDEFRLAVRKIITHIDAGSANDPDSAYSWAPSLCSIELGEFYRQMESNLALKEDLRAAILELDAWVPPGGGRDEWHRRGKLESERPWWKKANPSRLAGSVPGWESKITADAKENNGTARFYPDDSASETLPNQ
jgi:hypothetical protein